jgi:hypothetical protein
VLYVSTTVTVVAPAAVTVDVVIAAITVDAAGNAVGGGGGAELMGLALSCATLRASGGRPTLLIPK